MKYLSAILFSICLLGMSFVWAQNTSIHYEIAFPNVLHHQAEISISYAQLPPEPLQLHMSLASPGRYALHQFGKNVFNVQAFNEMGAPLTITRTSPETWLVEQHNGTVQITYTLFADHTDGTYSEIDDTHAHLNIPATFMWAAGLEKNPITIRFVPPENSDWKIATQLRKSEEKNHFYARDFQYFMDSPVEMSNFSQRDWKVKNPDGHTQTVNLVVHHDDGEETVDIFADMLKKVVLEHQAVFGELPHFDYDEYFFLSDYRSGNSGDGMEHRNSTICTAGFPLQDNESILIGTASHEFFHAWIIERVRPASLEPFDFTEANMCGELWFGEGFTSYYADLAICRAGIRSPDEFGRKISGWLNYVLNLPGTGAFSPVEMSKQAAFVDASTAIDADYFTNIFTSYYAYGAVIALALDLELRSRFEGLTLDDFMRTAWQEFGKSETPFTNSDLQSLLGKVCKDTLFANHFFKQHIYGTVIPDFKNLLAEAGFLLQQPHTALADLGIAKFNFTQKGASIKTYTRIGSPLYEAGLEKGDIIVKIGSEKVTDAESLANILKHYRPGAITSITYLHRGIEKTSRITLAPKNDWSVTLFEKTNKKLPKKAQILRDHWLSSKAIGNQKAD